jgi:hypothetical protein
MKKQNDTNKKNMKATRQGMSTSQSDISTDIGSEPSDDEAEAIDEPLAEQLPPGPRRSSCSS